MLTREQEERAILKTTISYDEDLEPTGSQLNPEQQREMFIRTRSQMSLNKHAQIIPMKGSGREVSTLSIDGRTLEVDDGTPSTKRGVTTQKKVLTGHRVKAAFKVDHAYLDQNTQGEDALDALTNAFTRKVGNGAEGLIINANTLGQAIKENEFVNDRDASASTTLYRVDSLYKKFDGMIKRGIDYGNKVDGQNSSNVRSLIAQGKKSLPSMYRSEENIGDLRAFMSVDIWENLAFQIGGRETPYGDMVLTKEGALYISGILCVPLSMMANNPKFTEHKTLTATTDYALEFKNIDGDEVIVTDQDLGATPVAKYVDTTDYVVTDATGMIKRVAAGDISSPYEQKITYEAPPLIIITPWQNLLIGLNEDMRIGQEYDLDTDTTLVVIRTRVDMVYVENEAVSVIKNVQDNLVIA